MSESGSGGAETDMRGEEERGGSTPRVGELVMVETSCSGAEAEGPRAREAKGIGEDRRERLESPYELRPSSSSELESACG